MFKPAFTLTSAITRALMSIEADRQAVSSLPIDVKVLASLKETARLATTHFSTQIEGNRLTQEQVGAVIGGARFPGRERDEEEARNYYRALEAVESMAARSGGGVGARGGGGTLTEESIRTIHGLVMSGKLQPTPYRDGQNVIRDSGTQGIVYLPPEAKDVPLLMAELVAWINASLQSGELPAPIIAGIAHYQFATIHPYYDGNGRTARLLTTLILHASGYGLKGIYSLEEYYARQLGDYYQALSVGPSHNYYMGRAEADITGFVDYFCRGMAESFAAVRAQAAKGALRGAVDRSPTLRNLDPRQRRLVVLFKDQKSASTAEIAAHLGLSPRTVTALCRQWIQSGFLTLANPSRKARLYGLSAEVEREVMGEG